MPALIANKSQKQFPEFINAPVPAASSCIHQCSSSTLFLLCRRNSIEVSIFWIGFAISHDGLRQMTMLLCNTSCEHTSLYNFQYTSCVMVCIGWSVKVSHCTLLYLRSLNFVRIFFCHPADDGHAGIEGIIPLLSQLMHGFLSASAVFGCVQKPFGNNLKT